MGSATPTADDPWRNALLAGLPAGERERLQRALEPLLMARNQVVYEPGAPLERIYFPTTAIVSLCCLLADGAADEIAVVGSEGVVGVALVMGGEMTRSRAVVERAGWAYSLRRRRVEEEFARGGALQHLLLRYVQALAAQVAQLAVCNRHHSIDQQLCRWLLMRLDRQASDELATTHEAIAGRMGVRREGVTEAAGKLQSARLIRHGRGHITVIDRAGLEARACECYGVVKREFDRLTALGAPWSVTAPHPGAATHGQRQAGPDADAGYLRGGFGGSGEVGAPRAAAAHQ
jgi:CRP-like cAMP-binding protein